MGTRLARERREAGVTIVAGRQRCDAKLHLANAANIGVGHDFNLTYISSISAKRGPLPLPKVPGGATPWFQDPSGPCPRGPCMATLIGKITFQDPSGPCPRGPAWQHTLETYVTFKIIIPWNNFKKESSRWPVLAGSRRWGEAVGSQKCRIRTTTRRPGSCSAP